MSMKLINQVIEQVMDKYQRQHDLYTANIAYAQLREDKSAWNTYEDEMNEWDITLDDGLEIVS